MSTIKYEGARFYKCALQVNPYTYASDYRGDAKHDEDQYNAGILEQCKVNGIAVVGLADHGRIENSESLRKILVDNKIVVFPGFEIASSEGIHMVCLYPEDTDVAQLNQYLGRLMGDNSDLLENTPTHPSSLSCQEIATQIMDKQKGFWYAAHATGKSGLLALDGRGGSHTHLWQNDHLLVAVQIPKSIDDLPNGENHKQIIRNQNRQYRRKKLVAVINAKDVETPETLATPTASCRIKMTKPNFSAFRTAFLDPDSRIRLNHEMPKLHHSVIKSVHWEGAGFFSSMGIVFSRHLNAIIGGRGTGKSTLIEGIRYALGRDDRTPDSKALDNLRKNNLSGSKIILKVVSQKMQGQKYTISRRYGEQSQVKNENGDLSNLTPEDILPTIEILGQNEILAIEQDEAAKRDLINAFLPNRHQVEGQIAEAKTKLANNRQRLLRAIEEFEVLESAVNTKQQLEEMADQFKKSGVGGKLKSASLLEQENNIREKIQDQFARVDEWLHDYGDVFDLAFFKDGNISDLPNKDTILKAQNILGILQHAIDASVTQAAAAQKSAKSSYDSLTSEWDASSDKIKDALNQAIAKLPEQVGKSGRQIGREYADIVKQLSHIKRQEQAYKAQKTAVDTIRQERNALLEEYRQMAFTRYGDASKSVDKLNQKDLRGKVKINLIQYGNVESLKEFFQGIPGIGQASLGWLNKPEVDLVKTAEWIRVGDITALREHYPGLSVSIANKLLTLKQQNEKLLRLEEIELEDTVHIELNVAHGAGEEHYVPLENLSTGQKCTAILNLLLLSNEAPLIVDQPEDHLDNAFIADRIVSDLRHLKTKRQFVFSTHNPNIPVFGDAELIAVLDCDQHGHGKVEHQGSIDHPEVKEHAANILEGGRAAFDMRKSKYGF